jgi:hypothetical protein
MASVTEHFIVAFPFAFELLRHWRIAGSIFHLRWSRFLQRRQRAISPLLKIADQFVVRLELQLQLNSECAFHCEIYIGRLHLDVRERSAF